MELGVKKCQDKSMKQICSFLFLDIIHNLFLDIIHDVSQYVKHYRNKITITPRNSYFRCNRDNQVKS